MDYFRERLGEEQDPLETNDKRLSANIERLMHEEWGADLAMQLLEYGQCYADVWDRDPMVMARATGRQEFGRWLRREIMRVTPRALMEAELATLNKEVNHDRER